MRVVAERFDDLPFDKLALGIRGAFLLIPVGLSPGHSGFIGGDHFVSGAVLAKAAVIDPDDAMAEAANLVELMGDEDDGASGGGDVAHFTDAFLLEIDGADGESFIDGGDFRCKKGGGGKG